ncbi:MAG TPA: UbiD family decarboxylase, partial [Xanthobacteraceae bacterium]
MTQVDTEKFRLRHFVEKLVQEGECVVHDAPIDLIDVAAVLDCNPNAVWFRAVGPEKTELVGNVMGTRRRLAAALDTDETGFPAALRERLRHPVAPIEVPSSDAPVHDVVLTGDDADLTSLPVHLQHGLDGAPYISASIDYARDPQSSVTNIGCRRLMLRGPRAAGVDLNAPSDLRALYQAAVARGERMPVAFAVGSHPTDFLAAVASTPPM